MSTKEIYAKYLVVKCSVNDRPYYYFYLSLRMKAMLWKTKDMLGMSVLHLLKPLSHIWMDSIQHNPVITQICT